MGFAKRVRPVQRSGLTYIDSAVCSENILADFLSRFDCLITYKLLADFRANFRLYVYSFNSSDSDLFHTLKLRLIVQNKAQLGFNLGVQRPNRQFQSIRKYRSYIVLYLPGPARLIFVYSRELKAGGGGGGIESIYV